MSMTVRREPFARGECKRFTTTNRHGDTWPTTCRFCGSVKKRMYSYVWWSDDKPEPRRDNDKWFCNIDCHDSYNN